MFYSEKLYTEKKGTCNTMINIRPLRKYTLSCLMVILIPFNLTMPDAGESSGTETVHYESSRPAPESAGPANDTTLRKYCENAGIDGIPENATLIALKEEKKLELWFGKGDSNKYVRSYRILAASGDAGPKLRKGDLQVPEGIYRINVMNPYSKYHLSMGIDYPNEFDRRMAVSDRRTNLGGDIYIHGGAVSSGCLAIGNAYIEELYFLVSRIGKDKVKVIIAPYDFRKTDLPATTGKAWIAELYKTIGQELKPYLHENSD